MRNISFQLTTPQFKARTKDVTRRLGWWNLKVGDVLMGCEKCQGIKKGEKIKKLGPIGVVKVNPEILNHISYDEVVREGFPSMSTSGFVDMFCEHMVCKPWVKVNRIEFEYL